MTITANPVRSPADQSIIDRLKNLLDEHNPCRFHKEEDGRVSCDAGTPCCGGCKFLTISGCAVKGGSAACMFWFCDTSWNNLDDGVKSQVMELLHQYQGGLRYRHDGHKFKKEWLFSRYQEHNPAILIA